ELRDDSVRQTSRPSPPPDATAGAKPKLTDPRGSTAQTPAQSLRAGFSLTAESHLKRPADRATQPGSDPPSANGRGPVPGGVYTSPNAVDQDRGDDRPGLAGARDPRADGRRGHGRSAAQLRARRSGRGRGQRRPRPRR